MKKLVNKKSDLIVLLLLGIFIVSIISLIVTIIFNSIFIGCNYTF